jgi:hypothetical protein
VGEDVGHVAGRAAGDQDHAERDRAADVEQQGQQERDRRQQQELRDHSDGDGPGPLRRELEVVQLRVERDPEEDRPDHDLERRQRALVEGDPDVVQVGGQHADETGHDLTPSSSISPRTADR